MKDHRYGTGITQIGDWCLLQRSRDFIIGKVAELSCGYVYRVRHGRRTSERRCGATAFIGSTNWLLPKASKIIGRRFKTLEAAQRCMAKYVNPKCREATAALRRNRERLYGAKSHRRAA